MQRNYLTGLKQMDYEVLNKLSDEDLVKFCQVDKAADSLCSDDQFWKYRILSNYGEKIIYLKPTDMSYKDFYTSPTFQKNIKLCLQIANIPKSSKLVAEQFYEPSLGFIDSTFTRTYILRYLLLKIAYSRMIKDGTEDIETIQKLKEIINTEIEKRRNDFFNNLPDLSYDTYNFTEKDGKEFRKIISVNVTRADILRQFSRKKTSEEFMKSLGKKSPIAFKLISFIHKGFYTGKLPLDITWDELCSHPFMLDILFD